MEEELDIILSAVDDASSTFQSVETAAEDLGNSLENVGDEATDDMRQLGDGADQATDDIKKLGDEAQKTGEEVEDLGGKSESSGATMQMAFQNIADGVMRAKEGVVELGRNLMETLNLAGQQEQQETFLKMNIGAEGAAKQMKIINDLVADLPGDDVAIGGLLSQAAAKNASITADELERMGVNAADYFAAMSNYGKSSVEAQQDLTNYILTGNTAELERSPILQGHIDKLKEATTVEERNKALQEAMNEEGWAGISQQDTYNNKLETFSAMLDRGKRQMGEMFLGAASGAMDFISQLDSATGGILGMGIAIGTVAGGPMIDVITGVGQMATGLGALRGALEGTAIATAISEGGFWSMAAAELAALWPIMAIIGALVALGVAVYEVGKYFGWWTDVGSMVDAIWAGVQRLWSAFINHPDVQGLLSAMGQAWHMLLPYITSAFKWVISFFTNANNKNKFDFVRGLINALGFAWRVLTSPIRLVIRVMQLLWSTTNTVGNNIGNTINNIRAWFAALPGHIRSAISTIASILMAPFQAGYIKIKGIVEKIIHAGESIANISLSGLTAKLTQPFSDAYTSIVDWARQTYEDAQGWYNRITTGGHAAGSEELLLLNEGIKPTTSYTTTGSLKVDQNIRLTLDMENIPQHVDEEIIYGIIRESFTDKTVLNALVNNSMFQDLDQRVKHRINMRNSRAEGGTA